MKRYDPDKPPDPADWLAGDEARRVQRGQQENVHESDSLQRSGVHDVKHEVDQQGHLKAQRQQDSETDRTDDGNHGDEVRGGLAERA